MSTCLALTLVANMGPLAVCLHHHLPHKCLPLMAFSHQLLALVASDDSTDELAEEDKISPNFLLSNRHDFLGVKI